MVVLENIADALFLNLLQNLLKDDLLLLCQKEFIRDSLNTRTALYKRTPVLFSKQTAYSIIKLHYFDWPLFISLTFEVF